MGTYRGSRFGLDALALWGPVKHRIFVSYHHRGDQIYYNTFSRIFHDTHEVIYDNSTERLIDSDDCEYVMRQIREKYITNTSCTIVLVGNYTWGRKYVDWEIKATLDKGHALIGVQLPTATVRQDGTVMVPARLNDNIRSQFALWLSWQQIIAHAAELERYIVLAKSRSMLLMNNSREMLMRNAPETQPFPSLLSGLSSI